MGKGAIKHRVVSFAQLRPDREDAYFALHATPWPIILELLASVGISDYSIYRQPGGPILMSTFSYCGTDLAADSGRLARHPEMMRWLEATGRCLISDGDDPPWSQAVEIFRMD